MDSCGASVFCAPPGRSSRTTAPETQVRYWAGVLVTSSSLPPSPWREKEVPVLAAVHLTATRGLLDTTECGSVCNQLLLLMFSPLSREGEGMG